MTIQTELESDKNGCRIVATHLNLPQAVSSQDNETGWKMSFKKLAKLLENS